MVAEGPAVKNFEAAQQSQIEYDLELLNEALDYAAQSGLIAHADRQAVKIHAEPPSVQVRNKLQEAQTRQIDMALGILSPQSATAEIGRDYDQEQLNIELHREKVGSLPGAVAGGFPSDEQTDQ